MNILPRSTGALAFTSGEQLHFAPGLYDPASREGVALLGHELTHVVQQREGRVANPYGHGVAIVQDPALEDEADRMGQRVAEEMWSAEGGQRLSIDHRAPQGDRHHRSARAPVVMLPMQQREGTVQHPFPDGVAVVQDPALEVAQPAAWSGNQKGQSVSTGGKRVKKRVFKARAADKDEKGSSHASGVDGSISATASCWWTMGGTSGWTKEGAPCVAAALHAEVAAYDKLCPKGGTKHNWVRITQNAFPCDKCQQYFDGMSRLHAGGIVIKVGNRPGVADGYSVHWPTAAATAAPAPAAAPAAAAPAAAAPARRTPAQIADDAHVASPPNNNRVLETYYAAPCEIYFVQGGHEVRQI